MGSKTREWQSSSQAFTEQYLEYAAYWGSEDGMLT